MEPVRPVRLSFEGCLARAQCSKLKYELTNS